MDKDKLKENLKDLKAFYEKHPKVFDELAGGIKMLFDTIKTEDEEVVANGVEYAMELTRAEQLLDDDLALRRKGAKIMSATIDLFKDIIQQKLI